MMPGLKTFGLKVMVLAPDTLASVIAARRVHSSTVTELMTTSAPVSQPPEPATASSSSPRLFTS